MSTNMEKKRGCFLTYRKIGSVRCKEALILPRGRRGGVGHVGRKGRIHFLPVTEGRGWHPYSRRGVTKRKQNTLV